MLARPSLIFCLLASLSVTGCAVAPERMANKSDLEVCRSFGIYRASGLWATSANSYHEEIKRRNLLSDDDWQMIGPKKIKVGMSRCAMYVAFGAPDRENATTSAYGRRVQHVYNAGYRFIKAYYIYTENDKVTAWQD